MQTLFQVSTFTNWAPVAFLSFHGCDKFAGNGYINGVEEPLQSGKARSSPTMLDFRFATWHCVSPQPQRWATFFFFTTFVILAGMVVLSLFIGVITIGMFTEYNKYTAERDVSNYNEGRNIAMQAFANPESILRMAVDFAMGIENPNVAEKFLIRKTHDGIVFERRSTRDSKSHESEFPVHQVYENNRFKKSLNSSISLDSGLRLSLDSGLQSPMQSPEVCDEGVPLPAENKSVWSRVRPTLLPKLSAAKAKKTRRGSFFAKADAQALLRQAALYQPTIYLTLVAWWMSWRKCLKSWWILRSFKISLQWLYLLLLLPWVFKLINEETRVWTRRLTLVAYLPSLLNVSWRSSRVARFVMPCILKCLIVSPLALHNPLYFKAPILFTFCLSYPIRSCF